MTDKQHPFTPPQTKVYRWWEEALTSLEQTVILLMPVTGRKKIERFDTIRRALKRLQELEGQG